MSSANLPDWPKARDRILGTIPNETNRAKLLEYLNEREANGIKASTLAIDANALRDLCVFLGEKTLADVTRKDITAFVTTKTRERIWRNLDRNGRETITRRTVTLNASTQAVRKVTLKCFFKWLRQTEDYPPEVRFLKATRPAPEPFGSDDLLTSDDLKALLQAHPDRRDKAILAVLYESGFRAGELCALNVGSVQFTQHGVRLTLPRGAAGLKTGARDVLLWDAAPFLRDFWENHPHKDQPEKPLFYSVSRRAPMARLTGGALHDLVRRAGNKAQLKKHVHPHLFRHSAATERVRLGWSEAQMRLHFGWRRNSDMPAFYNHASKADYERREMERRGLLKDGEEAKPALSSLLCPSCNHANLLTASFCHKCARPISPSAVADVEARQKEEIKQLVGKLVAEALGLTQGQPGEAAS